MEDATGAELEADCVAVWEESASAPIINSPDTFEPLAGDATYAKPQALEVVGM